MTKTSVGDGIPAELFQILKDDAVKTLPSICQQIWKTQQWPGLEKVSFHSNLKERQCQRMLKLPHHCTHFLCQQDYAQNSPSQASAVRELRTFRCTRWIQKKQRDQRKKLPTSSGSQKKQEDSPPKKPHIYFCFIEYSKAFDCVDHNKLWNILEEVVIPDHITCLLRNL